MAKKMADEAKRTKTGGNGFDPTVLKSIVGRIETLKEEVLSVRAKAMVECKALREDIGEVYEEGKARGIPKKELKKAITARELNRKIEALREDLDDMVERDTYDQIRHALGDLADTPLGAAATAGAPGAPGDDDDKDIRPAFLQGDGADKPLGDAALAVQAGIKQKRERKDANGVPIN